MNVRIRRPLWSFFLPATHSSRIRAIGYNSFMLMFLISSAAILNGQSYYRAALSEEDEKTYDRIDRRAYVALPDGRMALIYPIIDTQVSMNSLKGAPALFPGPKTQPARSATTADKNPPLTSVIKPSTVVDSPTSAKKKNNKQSKKAEAGSSPTTPKQRPSESTGSEKKKGSATPKQNPSESTGSEKKKGSATPKQNPSESTGSEKKKGSATPKQNPSESTGSEKKKGSATPKQKPSESSFSERKESSVTSVPESNIEYADDFEISQQLDSDDDIPTVEQIVSKKAPSEPLSAASYSQVFEEPEDDTAALEKKNMELERIAKEEELKSREDELKQQIELFKQQQQAMSDAMKGQNIEPVREDPVVAEPSSGKNEPPPPLREVEEEHPPQPERRVTEAQHAELERRRERERTLRQQRAHEEEAVRHLFQRLAQDVREVFRELNLSVIAAEKERLLKDERYRKEKEARDRREEQQHTERLLREVKEREEREAKFWSRADEREQEFRTLIEERLKRDEEEREARLKRDLQDSAERARKDRELRSQLEALERERRTQATADAHQRDNLFIQSQIENIKSQYASQLEDIRNQNERDYARREELHRSELEMIQKRSDAASQQLLNQHAKQLALAETHFGKVDKLERILESLHAEVEATKKLNETLTKERLSTLDDKERQLEEQGALLQAMMDDLKDGKLQMERERARVTALYAKFELLLENFTKNAEADRRQLQETQSRLETFRQQVDKDRRLVLSEISQERKVLEQQTEEFFSRKMEAMGELQAERLAISRERTEAAVMRERQNRDETELLKSLRSREEEYALKIEAIDADRSAVSQMKMELKQASEKIAAERDAIAKEREIFEFEKQELLVRFEEIRRRAHDAANMQEKMRMALVQERAATEFGIQPGPPAASRPPPQSSEHTDPGAVATAMTNLQIDLAHQRAILKRMTT